MLTLGVVGGKRLLMNFDKADAQFDLLRRYKKVAIESGARGVRGGIKAAPVTPQGTFGAYGGENADLESPPVV